LLLLLLLLVWVVWVVWMGVDAANCALAGPSKLPNPSRDGGGVTLARLPVPAAATTDDVVAADVAVVAVAALWDGVEAVGCA
jgi:hypothetical protein